ncbi:Protein sel-1 1 [Blomia tropicalis]|nr:Protein sel-1 1 [Blomia tropicalis]
MAIKPSFNRTIIFVAFFFITVQLLWSSPILCEEVQQEQEQILNHEDISSENVDNDDEIIIDDNNSGDDDNSQQISKTEENSDKISSNDSKDGHTKSIGNEEILISSTNKTNNTKSEEKNDKTMDIDDSINSNDSLENSNKEKSKLAEEDEEEEENKDDNYDYALNNDDNTLSQDYRYAIKIINEIAEKNQFTDLKLLSKSYEHPDFAFIDALVVLNEAANHGIDIAKLVLAKMYFFGDRVKMNHYEAYRLFKELSSKGNGDAHLFIGLMYSIGLGPLKSNQAKALLHYTFSALANSTIAQMILGYRYWSGIGVMSKCEFALSHYRKVAAKVEQGITFSGSTSIQRIRLLDELENPGTYNGVLDDDLIQYYQFLADKGDVQAQVGLGQLHFQGGRGVELNPNRAYHYFKLAAESGNTNAMAYLGKMHLEGNKVVIRDYEKAYKYFKMAAEKGNPVGQSGLGIIYLYGKGVEKDFAMAFKYFSQAAIQGWVDGQLYLGLMYLRGYSVTKDPKSAIKYFTLASQSGHILGFYNLAEMHATGTGTLRSCTTAVELFKSVSERGPWGAMLMQAHANYKDGDRANAFIKYAVLSELGYEVAQSNAAFMLDREELVQLFNKSENHVRAFMYWSRSATQGSSAARVKLGDYHFYGLGTVVDYEMAANQYRSASELQGNAQALFNLGYMYETGLGLRRDIYLAKRYYDLAAVTSVEAQVPVFLVLIKLFFIFAYEYVQGLNKWSDMFEWTPSALMGDDWDLYIMTVLAMIMGMIYYLRRQGAG